MAKRSKGTAVSKRAGAGVDLSVMGRTGLKQYGGYIYEEQHPKLRGLRGPRAYREMAENDAVVGAVLYVIRTWASQATWRTEPANETPEAQYWADLLASCKDDMSHTWSNFVSEVLSMVPEGWSYFEVCYKRRAGRSQDSTKNSAYNDGYIGWRKFSIRKQDTLDHWEFDVDGGIQGLWQLPPDCPQRIFIPIAKALLFRTQVTGNNPEGRSMLRSAFRSWYILRRIQEIEAIGIERDLAGYPVMEVPLALFDEQATPEDKEALRKAEELVTDIRRDEREGAVVPASEDEDGVTGYKLRLMSTGGQRAINIDTTIKRYESRIAMTLLAEFILLGSDKVGSFSMHASKTDVFAVSLRTLLKSIEDVLNRHAVERLMLINGCPIELMPRLVVGEVAPPPLGELGDFVAKISGAGLLMHDEPLEAALREVAGLPEKAEDTTGVLEEERAQREAEAEAERTPTTPGQTPTTPPDQTQSQEGDASDGAATDETGEPEAA